MRRLALPAVFACLAMVAVPTAALATGLGRERPCPAGPAAVASHTDMEPSADGQRVGVQFALEEGCEDVDVSLLSYQLAPGPTQLASPEQVVYDAVTATASAGQVNDLEVAVVPGCWSLVKLVAGRPPAGAAGMRAWDRRNTVDSKWTDGRAVCPGVAASPLEREDSLLGSLLQGPDAPASGLDLGAPATMLPGLGVPGSTVAGGERVGVAGADDPARVPDAAGTVGAGDGAGGPDLGEDARAGGTAGAASAPRAAAAGTGRPAGGAGSRPVIAADGALPLTGSNAAAVLVGGIGLVVVGTLVVRRARRYRARHLAAS
jgi:LPXTG-motif cell wall-anchored protein